MWLINVLEKIISKIYLCIFFIVVNDQNRIISVVSEKNTIPNKYTAKTINTVAQKNRSQNNDDYYASSPRQVNGPIVATAATTSLTTAGGIIGVGQSRRDESRVYPLDESYNLPYNSKKAYTSPIDGYLVNSRNPSTYAKPSSLVSATMKISSATTELYQKNNSDSHIDGQRDNLLLGKGDAMDTRTTNIGNSSTNYNPQTQVCVFM